MGQQQGGMMGQQQGGMMGQQQGGMMGQQQPQRTTQPQFNPFATLAGSSFPTSTATTTAAEKIDF
jgi:hypothetical protein